MNREQIEELAIQFSTEGLSPVEEMLFQSWVDGASREDKAIFTEMVDLCSDVTVDAAKLSQSSEEVSPSVKGQLLQMIASQNSSDIHRDNEMLHIAKDRQEWINLPIKGAQLLELSARKSDGFAVSIIDLEPGSEFPEHDHHGVEMAYILEGDLEADGVIFNAGDFFRVDAGSHHGTHRSPSGCQALIITANENYKHKSIKTLGAVQRVYRSCKKLLTK